MVKKAVPFLKRVWKFLWEDDSIWSWLANIALAFILIKFLILPGLGLVFGTSYPIVAVVSGSMEHDGRFDEWWQTQEARYQAFNISRGEFEDFPLRDGFDKGDIIVLFGVTEERIEVGDVIVFRAQDPIRRPDPIIHRVVAVERQGEDTTIQTKGDHNIAQIKSVEIDETNIKPEQVVGRAWLRIPLLGYIKIWFVDSVNLIVGLVR